MSAANTVRFTAEFDDTKLTQSLNRVKSTLQQTFANMPGIQALEQQFAGAQQELETLEQSTNALEQSFNTLDSSTSGVNTSLDEIGNAANTAGQNFDTLGTSTSTIEQQLADIGTTSVTAGQSMSALGGSADTTATSMGALQSNFEGVSGGLTSTNTLFGETTGAMADVDSQAQTTGERMGKIWSKGSGIAVGISATISGIANLVRGFRDYGDAQNKVGKANLALSKAQEAVTKAQEKYNGAVAGFGKNSVEAQKALVDLGQANDALGIKQSNLAVATKRAGDAQTDIWLGLAGTVTGIGGSIIQSLDAIGGEKGLAGLGTKVKGLVPALTSLGGSFGIAGGAALALGVPLAAVTAAVLLAVHVFEGMNNVTDAFAANGIKLTSATEDINRNFSEMDKIIKVTKMGREEIILFPAKAAAEFVKMGGKWDENGKIILSTNEEIQNDTRNSMQVIADAIHSAIDPNYDWQKATEGSANAIKAATAVVNTHIPTVINLSSSVRSLGYDTREAYTIGAKALDMYNVEQQKNTGVINAGYEGFKKLYGGITTTTTTIATTNKTIGQSTDAYTKWIDAGVDPANKAIATYSKGVISGAISQEDLGKAVQLTIDPMVKSGVITEEAGVAATKLAVAHLSKLIPSLKESKQVTEEFSDVLQNRLTKALEDAYTRGTIPFKDALANSKNPMNDYNVALQTGADQAGEWIKQSQLGTVSTNRFHDALAAYAEKELGVKNAMQLTTAELKTRIDAANGNVDAIAELNKQHTDWAAKVKEVADKYKTDLNPALLDTPEKLDAITKALEAHAKALEESEKAVESAHQAFSSLFDATKVKDFNKTLKEMNLDEALGKPFEKAVKRLGPSFVDLNINLNNAKLGLEGLLTFGSKVEFTTFSNGLDTWVDSLENLAATDPDTSTEKMDNLFQSIRQMTSAELQQHAGSLTSLINAMMSGKNIDSKAVADFFTQFSNEKTTAIGKTATNVGALGTAAGNAADPLNKAGTGAGSLGTNLNTITPPDLNPFAEALNTVILLMNDLSRRISTTKFVLPAPDIHFATDGILKVAKAFDTLVNGINKAKPTITVNNSQALAAINAVVNAQGKIKNILQVIKGNNSDALSKINQVVNAQGKIKNITQTITTVYKTVGSPAHTSTRVGVGAHTNTRLGTTTAAAGAGETVAIAPLIGGGGGGAGVGGMGDVNITIVNRDEFGTEKIRKFKAVLGKDRYVFGASGSGG